MGRTRDEIMTGLPEAHRAQVDARAAELALEVEGLKVLREMAERASTTTVPSGRSGLAQRS